MKKYILMGGLLVLCTNVQAQEVDINCSEGANWQKEKRSVIDIGGYGSASLLYGGNGKAYLFTARHCLETETIGTVFNSSLRFNHENTTCGGGVDNPRDTTISVKLKMVAKSMSTSNLDYSLAEVQSDLSSIGGGVYLSGWNAVDVAPLSGVNIAHPGLRPTKIATYTIPPIVFSSTDLNMHVLMSRTANGYQGVTGGSSGSPLFDQNHRVVGTIISGYATSDYPVLADGLNPVEVVSKFSSGWNNGVDGNKIQNILDSNNTSMKYMNGMEYGEFKRLTNGAKYIVSKNSNYNIGNGGCWCNVVQQNIDRDPGYEFNCTNCTPHSEDNMRSTNRWYLSVDEYGFYKFTHQMDGFLMEIPDASTSAGADVKTYAGRTYPNDKNQRFRLIPTGDGDNSYFIENVNSGLFLDVNGGSTSAGAKVIQWTYNGNNNQKWYFKDGSTGSTMKQAQGGNIEEPLSSVLVFPTSATDKISVSEPISDLIVSGQIFDMQGRLMQQYPATGNITTIDISNYPSGMYIMKVALKNGDIKVQKFTKN
jgi:hypothetical protein